MKTYIEQLFENCGLEVPSEYLVEGASAKAPQYKVNSPEEFEMLVAQDPTYDSAKDDGKFIDWIFSLWRNYKTDEQKEKKYQKAVAYKQEHPDAQLPPKPTKLSQDKLEDFRKIGDYLKVLNKNMKDLKGNISQFKSIADLALFVNKIRDRDTIVGGIASSDFLKEAIADGLEIVYNGPNFIIGVPTTYEASEHFKKPVTDWCTAYPDKYYDYVSDGSKLYIHINKKDGKLYQLSDNSGEFKDDLDFEINKEEFIRKYPELKEFYDKILSFDDVTLFCLHSRLPNKEEQQKMKQELYNSNTYNINKQDILNYIKNNINNLSIDLQKEYLKENPSGIKLIKNPTEEMKLFALKHNVELIEYIKNPTEEMKLYVIKKDPSLIKFIKNPSEKIQLYTMDRINEIYKNRGGMILTFIKNPTKKVIIQAIAQTPDVLEYIENPSKEIQIEAIKQNPTLIKNIKNPCEEAIKLARKLGYNG